ncbi:MAG: hypothetical protein ABSG67_09305 [Thermoguttaceae bacterium]
MTDSMDERNNLLFNTISRAMIDNLSKLHVAFVDVVGEEPKTLASGILVLVEKHLFVATAAHVIPSNPETRLAFASRTSRDLKPGLPVVLRYGKPASDWPDVGFLELALEGTLSVLTKEAIGLERISLLGPGDPSQLCFLCGYPEDLKWLSRPSKYEGHLSFQGSCYTNNPIRHTMWPIVSLDDHPTDQKVDIFLPYDQEEEMCFHEENEGHNHLGEPFGMSGGGLWQAVPCGNSVWSPEQVQLFGIQSAWNKKCKYVRASQVIHWIHLIYENYCDLRHTLVERFPNLKSLA